MDVTSVTAPSANQVQKPKAAQDAVISSDFETFLKMLTVQMENQDPLNPIESTDYAVQLATFSGVEQQVQTNDLLRMLSSQLGAMSMSDLAGWVGMEALSSEPVKFSSSPITLYPEPASGAEKTYMRVLNEAGTEVDRLEIPVSKDPVQWAGVNASGNPFPEGNYQFQLVSVSQQRILSEEPIKAYATVTEARSENGETILVLDSGGQVKASEVASLRSPDQATE